MPDRIIGSLSTVPAYVYAAISGFLNGMVFWVGSWDAGVISTSITVITASLIGSLGMAIKVLGPAVNSHRKQRDEFMQTSFAKEMERLARENQALRESNQCLRLDVARRDDLLSIRDRRITELTEQQTELFRIMAGRKIIDVDVKVVPDANHQIP